MKLTQTERAFKLGISQNFFSLIYNGRRLPGWDTVQRWNNEAIICKSYLWWRGATLSQIQNVMDKIK